MPLPSKYAVTMITVAMVTVAVVIVTMVTVTIFHVNTLTEHSDIVFWFIIHEKQSRLLPYVLKILVLFSNGEIFKLFYVL